LSRQGLDRTGGQVRDRGRQAVLADLEHAGLEQGPDSRIGRIEVRAGDGPSDRESGRLQQVGAVGQAEGQVEAGCGKLQRQVRRKRGGRYRLPRR
jgi:hypothetical protein